MKLEEQEQSILDIEAQAAEIDPADKEALYDMLVVAYYKLKDIIVTLKAAQPETVKVIDTDLVDELTFKLSELEKLANAQATDLERAEAKLVSVKEIVNI